MAILGTRVTEPSGTGRRRPWCLHEQYQQQAGNQERTAATRSTAPGASHAGEFDPGSGTTLAACLTHASRAGHGFGHGQRRTGEERVADLPGGGGQPREIGAITAYARRSVGSARKALRGAIGGGCVRLASWRGDGPPRRRSVAGLRGRAATGGLRHGPHTYGWQQRGIFPNGRKPEGATPRAGRRPSGRKPLLGGTRMTEPPE